MTVRALQDALVNIRAIHAGTNTVLWASTFDRTLPDLPVLQRDIARAIATELRIALYPRTAARWQSVQAVDATAYDEYLRGRYQLRRQTQAGAQNALAHFERAVRIEPRYARAHAGIAECYLMLGSDFTVMSTAESSRLAKESAMRPAVRRRAAGRPRRARGDQVRVRLGVQGSR